MLQEAVNPGFLDSNLAYRDKKNLIIVLSLQSIKVDFPVPLKALKRPRLGRQE